MYKAIFPLYLAVLLLGVADEMPKTPKTGQFTATFKAHSEFSSPPAIGKRVDDLKLRGSLRRMDKPGYLIGSETFQVYVPDDYESWKPHGLLVWIPDGDTGTLPTGWEEVLTELHLIWIAPNKAGAEQDQLRRRVPLALDAWHNIAKAYNIDPERVYLGGFASGAGVACDMATAFSDIFKGGLFMGYATHWESLPLPSGLYTNPSWQPRVRHEHEAERHCRYIFLAGKKDENRDLVEAVYDKYADEFDERARFFPIFDYGHEPVNAKWLKTALLTLDRPLREKGEELQRKAVSKEEEVGKVAALPLYFQAMTYGNKAAKKKYEDLFKAIADGTDAIKHAVRKHKLYDAYQKSKALVDEYGKELAANAYRIKTRIEAKKVIMAEINAEGELRRIQTTIEGNAAKDKIKAELKALIEKHKGTKAAAQAAEMLQNLN